MSPFKSRKLSLSGDRRGNHRFKAQDKFYALLSAFKMEGSMCHGMHGTSRNWLVPGAAIKGRDPSFILARDWIPSSMLLSLEMKFT
jgi:hypothetical protein